MIEFQSGEVIVKLHPEWAPIAVGRIKELTADSFWDECRAFRVLPNFVVQLGINGNPQKQHKWKHNIKDESSVKASNTRGTVTFAMAGPNTRTTQIFFNKVNNSRLDKENFAPFGEVIRYDFRCHVYFIIVKLLAGPSPFYASSVIVEWM